MSSEFLLGGVAAASSAVLTNPAEVVKTRFQLQGELENGRQRPYRNVIQAALAIGKHEGIAGLQRGLAASMAYQFVMNGLRFGVYQAFVEHGAIHRSDGTVSVPRSIAFGALSGATAAWIGNPLYLVKIRMQSSCSAPHLTVGMQHHYSNMYIGLRDVYQRQGLAGLWRGAHASVLRVSVGSAAQLSVFSKSKDAIARALRVSHDSHLVSFLGSFISGFMVVFIMHPFDLVCTRFFNQPSRGALAGSSSRQYRGVIDCFRSVVTLEGMRALYVGFWAGYARLAPHTFLCLFIWDELRLWTNRFR